MSGEQTGTSAANSLAGDPGKTAGMKFIARQPVFDRKQRIFGYELLFRSSSENSFDGRDVNQASLNVIANGVLFHVLEELTEKHKAFVNFSRDALLGDYALFLPKELTIVEVLEGVSIDDDVLSALTRLKDKGYCIALDDVVSTERLHNLLDLVHIVKVDMALSTPDQRQDLAEILAPRGISLLAEKVETHDQFCEAADLGFHYFQGYFFARPLHVAGDPSAATGSQRNRAFDQTGKLLLLQTAALFEFAFFRIPKHDPIHPARRLPVGRAPHQKLGLDAGVDRPQR